MSEDETVAEVETAEADEVDTEEVETAKTDSEEQVEDTEIKADAEDEVEDPPESSPEKEDEGFEKRAAELTSRYYTEKQQKEFYKNQYEGLLEQQKPTVETGKTLADFDYDEAKFADYVNAQARQEALDDARAEAMREQAMKRDVEFQVREDAFASKATDYQAVTRNPNIYYTEAVVEAAKASDKGPELLYYLGKHPEIANTIFEMPPLKAAIEMGKIEARLGSEKPPSVSKAPKPVPKIQGTDDKSPIRINDPKISDAQFRKLREKQIANR